MPRSEDAGWHTRPWHGPSHFPSVSLSDCSVLEAAIAFTQPGSVCDTLGLTSHSVAPVSEGNVPYEWGFLTVHCTQAGGCPYPP